MVAVTDSIKFGFGPLGSPPGAGDTIPGWAHNSSHKHLV